MITLLIGLHIKMEGHNLLEGRVDQSIRFGGVDGFNVFFAMIAGIDAIFVFLFTEKIAHRFFVVFVAKRAWTSLCGPGLPAKAANQGALAFIFQNRKHGRITANGAVSLLPRILTIQIN